MYIDEKASNLCATKLLWVHSIFKCEKIFGFNLEGYGKVRMYTFLAERFLPFWFKKYSNYLEWPVIYYDIGKMK